MLAFLLSLDQEHEGRGTKEIPVRFSRFSLRSIRPDPWTYFTNSFLFSSSMLGRVALCEGQTGENEWRLSC